MDSDSAKAFEEWWQSEHQATAFYSKTDSERVWDAAWRASGRWHRLAALRECEKLAQFEADLAESGNEFGPESVVLNIRALIAAEEKQHG